MNFKGLKKKLIRFKSFFRDQWSVFTAKYSRYNTYYYHTKIKKDSSALIKLHVIMYLLCGQGQHKIQLRNI